MTNHKTVYSTDSLKHERNITPDYDLIQGLGFGCSCERLDAYMDPVWCEGYGVITKEELAIEHKRLDDGRYKKPMTSEEKAIYSKMQSYWRYRGNMMKNSNARLQNSA